MNKDIKSQSGQALITLLIFVVVATMIIAGAVAVTVINIQSSSKFAQGEKALRTTESGVEEVLIRLLRDPNYGSTPFNLPLNGETLSVTITTVSSTKTIDVFCTTCTFKRKIEVVATYTNKMVVNSWREIN